MSPALSSGLEAHSAVGQKPSRRIEYSLRTGRSSPFAELRFGMLGSAPPAYRRIHLSRRLELDFSRAYSLADDRPAHEEVQYEAQIANRVHANLVVQLCVPLRPARGSGGVVTRIRLRHLGPHLASPISQPLLHPVRPIPLAARQVRRLRDVLREIV